MKLKTLFASAKRKHLFAGLTVAILVLFFALNLLVSALGLQNSAYIDMTREGLYTLSDAMKEECKVLDEIDGEVKMIFCADPDVLAASRASRVVYFMALKIQQRHKNFKVETVNVVQNPTAVSMYKTTSLTTIAQSDLILTYGSTYRISSIANFWLKDETDGYYSYNGEYRLMTLLHSIIAIDRPVAYMLTGHGETVFDENDLESAESLKTAALRDMLTAQGLDVKLLDLSKVERVPDDCALLIINDPKTDFTYDADALDTFGYVSDLEKIDRYLLRKNGAHALAVAKDYRIKLPALEGLLYEWGFLFGDSIVKDESNCLDGDPTVLIAQYDRDGSGYGDAIYKEISSLTSAPRTILTNAGEITCSFWETDSQSEQGNYNAQRSFATFLNTSPDSRTYSADNVLTGDRGERVLAAVTARTNVNSVSAETKYAYVFCANSADFFSNELLGNTAYGNQPILSLLFRNISRVDEYASLELGGQSLNSPSFGGKILNDTSMSAMPRELFLNDGASYVTHAVTDGVKTTVTILLAILPIAGAICGIYVCIRRKFL